MCKVQGELEVLEYLINDAVQKYTSNYDSSSASYLNKIL